MALAAHFLQRLDGFVQFAPDNWTLLDDEGRPLAFYGVERARSFVAPLVQIAFDHKHPTERALARLVSHGSRATAV